MKVAWITNTVHAYRVPLWKAIEARGIELQLVLCEGLPADGPGDTDDINLGTLTVHPISGGRLRIPGLDHSMSLAQGMTRALREIGPDVIVVTGWQTPGYWKAIWFARKNRVPLIFWHESHALSTRFTRGPIQVAKQRIVRCADAYVASGTMARDQLIDLGVDASKIAMAPNAIDVERWRTLVHKQEQESSASRNPITFLYVGQFIPRKGVTELVAAFRELRPTDARLVMMGEGPLKEKIRQSARTIPNLVVLPPVLGDREKAQQFRAADVLVLPSLREVWGMAVNEGLAAGLFVIASSRAGATRDLVDPAPFAGLSFDPSNHEEFVAVLKSAMNRFRAGLVSPKLISQHGARFTISATVDAIQAAISFTSRKVP